MSDKSKMLEAELSAFSDGEVLPYSDEPPQEGAAGAAAAGGRRPIYRPSAGSSNTSSDSKYSCISLT